MVKRSERTEPAAEGPAEQERHRDEQKGQEEGGREFVRREKRSQKNEKVGIEEDLHGVGELVSPVIVRLDEKDEKEKKKRALGKSSCQLLGVGEGPHGVSGGF